MSPLIFAVLSIIFTAVLWLCHHKTTHKPPLPPGPRGLPIIGSLHLIGSLPHRSLAQFSKKYGPIMSLRLGSVLTVVVSSAQAAELFLKTHDNVFASRPKTQASKYLSYNNSAMVFRPFGTYWRKVRSFCTLELLSAKKVEGLAGMRKEELMVLVEEVKAKAAASEAVDLSEKVGEVIEKMSCRMIFGRCKYDKANLKSIVSNMFYLVGASNLADYVPFLSPFDIQGLARRMKKASKDFDGILEPIIQEHEENPNNESSIHDDFIDMMLVKSKSKEDNDDNSLTINRSNMKAIVLDMIAGGIDTSNVTIQWTLSELIKSPRTMEKLQQELDDVVGRNRMVEESDLSNLTYLNMVVKEGLRLHAPGPLLVPHESLEDIVINGYFIPKSSRLLINFWAIARDQDAWSHNAEEFYPERFIGSNIDLKGRDFKFIPFGSGRRGCPGMKLGLINIQIVVAQLVHCFDWKLPDGMLPADLDMTEVFGLTLPRAKPLLAVPTYRL